jgi:RNA-directed DNA polymerase
MSLEPDQVERLRQKLYEKAKREPDFRFYSLYDKVCWAATLERAFRQAKANAGAAGVDGERFEDIKTYGEDRWLAELRQELVEETYRPQPVRRVTRLCQTREEPFDFLGYTFGPARHWLTGKRFLSARPTKKAQKRLKEKINALLYRGNPTPWPELQARLNQLLKGWAGYFSFGYTGDADQAIRWHVAGRVRRFLCRRHKLPPGTGHFGFSEVYGKKVGVTDIRQLRLQRRPVHALS